MYLNGWRGRQGHYKSSLISLLPAVVQWVVLCGIKICLSWFFCMLIARHAYKETVLFYCALHLASCHSLQQSRCVLAMFMKLSSITIQEKCFKEGKNIVVWVDSWSMYFHIACDFSACLITAFAICIFILKIQVRWCFALELDEAEHTAMQQWFLHQHGLSLDILSVFFLLLSDLLPKLDLPPWRRLSLKAYMRFRLFAFFCSLRKLMPDCFLSFSSPPFPFSPPSPWQSCCLISLFQYSSYSLASSGKVMKRHIRLLSGCTVSS